VVEGARRPDTRGDLGTVAVQPAEHDPVACRRRTKNRPNGVAGMQSDPLDRDARLQCRLRSRHGTEPCYRTVDARPGRETRFFSSLSLTGVYGLHHRFVASPERGARKTTLWLPPDGRG